MSTATLARSVAWYSAAGQTSNQYWRQVLELLLNRCSTQVSRDMLDGAAEPRLQRHGRC